MPKIPVLALDWSWLSREPGEWWQIVVASLCILLAVIVVVRLSGPRTFGKMTSFDFAVTVATGSILGGAATGSVSVLTGSLAIATLIVMQAGLSLLIRKTDRAARLICNSPLLLMEGSRILDDNLTRARLSTSELIAKLREANVLNRNQVRAVVLETTGDISVLHAGNADEELEAWLLEDVRRGPSSSVQE